MQSHMGILSWKLEEMLPEERKMQRDIRQKLPRLLTGISAMLVCMACMPIAQAEDYRFGYSTSYHYPYGSYGAHENFRLQREINHMGDEMRRQQRKLDQQTRLQQEQTRLLKQQQSARQRVTARQACYYRYDGGLDLCDRLFSATSKKHAACVETVAEINSGCAEDIARSTIKSGR